MCVNYKPGQWMCKKCRSVDLNYLSAVGLTISYLLFFSYCVLKVRCDLGVAERVALFQFEVGSDIRKSAGEVRKLWLMSIEQSQSV